jgi:hypothetical protein
MTIKVGSHVNRKGEKNPTGIVEKVTPAGNATVNWGTMDKKTHREHIHVNNLKHTSPKVVG